METITYRVTENGAVLVKQVPWGVRNQAVALAEAISGEVRYSMSQPPEQPQDVITLLKQQLVDTDYQITKFVEGFLSVEEYLALRDQRAQWRVEINELEEVYPK